MTRTHLCIPIAVAALWRLPGAPAEEPAPSFRALFRHAHYFLVWNDAKDAPHMTLVTKQYANYGDMIAYKVIGADSEVLASGSLPVNSQKEITGIPLSPKYLIWADPGLNGVALRVNRPHGICGGRTHPIGLNHPTGRLYLYVPAECAEFTLFVESSSPHEGAWVKTLRPDGQLAGEAEGELDDEAPIRVTVPPDCRGKAWAVEFAAPKAPNIGLDDLNLCVEGKLPPVFVPEKDWAERYAKELEVGE